MAFTMKFEGDPADFFPLFRASVRFVTQDENGIWISSSDDDDDDEDGPYCLLPDEVPLAVGPEPLQLKLARKAPVRPG